MNTLTPEQREKRRASALAWYHANREKVNAKARARYVPRPRKPSKYGVSYATDRKEYYRVWRDANRDKFRGYMRKHYFKYLDVNRALHRHWAKLKRERNPDMARLKSQMQRDQLSNSYIARNILGIPTRECPPELIAMVREHVRLRRELRSK